MGYEDRKNQLVRTENVGFEARLRAAVDQRISQGNTGIYPMKTDAGKVKLDLSGTPVFRDFWMGDDVFQLAVTLAERRVPVDPHVWAAWMMNTLIQDWGGQVVVRIPSKCRADYADKHFGHTLKKHFGKKVIFQVDQSLRDRMERIAA